MDLNDPGSTTYSIVKSVQGDFNQADAKFGASAETQCAINSLVAICFSNVNKISTWNNVHINFVLENGDSVYKDDGYIGYINFQQLPEKLVLQGIEFSVIKLLHNESETTREFELHDDNNISSKVFWETTFLENLNKSDGAILVMNSSMFMIKKCSSFFYLFDSHSRGAQGLQCNSGTSIVLKFRNVNEIKNYLQHIHLTVFQKTKLWFQLQFFKCTCIDANKLLATFKNYQSKTRAFKLFNKNGQEKREKKIGNLQ